MTNAKCVFCGSSGYQGFSKFECSNASCQFYVASEPVIATKAQTFGPSILSSSMPAVGPINYRQQAAMSAPQQHIIGLEFLNMLINGQNGISPLGDKVAVIAGGAARDWYFGNAAKDVDVFVEDFKEWNFRAAFPMLTLVGKTSQNTGVRYPPSFTVWDVVYKGVDFQIIQTESGKTVEEHINQFDFGINKIMITPSGGVCPFKQFDDDFYNKTLTVDAATLDPAHLKSLGARTAKMMAKFPGYTVRIT
jgi:hypothetical protein